MNELVMKIVEEQRLDAFMKLNPEWLGDCEVYHFVKNYFDSYNGLPPYALVKKKFDYDSDAPFEYWWDEYENAGIVKEFSKIDFSLLNQQIMTGQAKEALAQLQKAIDRIQNKTTSESLTISMDRLVEMFKEYLKEVAEQGYELIGIPTGWKTLDGVTGGMKGGDLCLITGRVKTGKTMALLHIFRYAHIAGNKIMFVSMEMSLLDVAKRLFSIYTKIPADIIRSGKLSHFGMKVLNERLQELKSLPECLFIDGKLALGVRELKSVVFANKPNLLVIDGGYLIKAVTRYTKSSTWERAKEIADDLKQLALTADIPVVATFQLTREVAKKSSEAVGLEHIHLTDALSANCSWAIGIFDIEGDETKKMVRVLGTREGEPEDFIINWDWERMDFSEIEKED